MKIAVIEFAGRGGLIHYAFQLCRALAAAGAEVTLVTDRNYELDALPAPFRVVKLFRMWDPKPATERETRGARLPRNLRRAGRAVRHYREWLRLVGFLRRERPDVVQFGDIRFPGDLLPLFMVRSLGLRMSDVCHNVFPFALGGRAAGLFRRSATDRSVYRRIYALFDTVFVHYEVNRRRFADAYGAGVARVTAIPHGNEAIFDELADPGVTPAALRQRLDLDPGAPVVLFFGTLARYKGVDLLVEAFVRLSRREPGALLVIAGFPAAGFDLEDLQRRTREHGVEDRVRLFPGYVPAEEVAAWMRLAGVVVFPYREIYQSGVLHMAQTFGAPIVGTEVGAIPEVIDHERNGLLVPAEDPEALAAALERLLRDAGLAARIGAAARADAFTRYGWDRVAETVLQEYRRADAGARGGAG